jgi:CheY-like chemotaxis protein
MKNKKILIVDDDLAVLEVLSLMLKDDYEVITATNGKEAIDKYRKFKPDLVLMDVVMPEMDGIRATKEILKIDPNAKIIAIWQNECRHCKCESVYAKHRGKDMLKASAIDI